MSELFKANKVIIMAMVLVFYCISTITVTDIYRCGLEEQTWKSVRDQGLTIRDDAIINSPTIIYKVSLTEFIKLAKDNNLETFFIGRDSNSYLNSLIIVKDSQTGYIVSPAEYTDTFKILTLQNPFYYK